MNRLHSYKGYNGIRPIHGQSVEAFGENKYKSWYCSIDGNHRNATEIEF